MSRSSAAIYNEGNLSKLSSIAQVSRLGDILSLAPKFVRAAVSANVLSLPEGSRALVVTSAYAVTGGATGQLTPVLPGSTPAASQVSVDAAGNVLFAAADAVTEAEVTYVEAEGQLFEETVTVASDLAQLVGEKRAVVLVEVEATAGTAVGAKTIVARGTAPAAGEAAINDLGQVAFNAADAVTQARVKYIATPGVGAANKAVSTDLEVEDKEF